MFRESRQLPRTLCAASALALVLGAGMVGDYVEFDMSIVSSAHAAQPAGGGRGEKGAGPSGDVRGGVKPGRSDSGRGGKSMADVLADEEEDDGPPEWAKGNKEPGTPPPADDDSDRPDWAGGDKDLNPHRGDPNPTPGVDKGDDYGDLWVVLRNDVGEPILDGNGNVQPVLEDGTVVQLTDPDGDGKYELPPEYTDLVQEVEIGRSNVARAPDRVITHSLEEALSKLDDATYVETVFDPATADTSNVYIDPAGRLVYYNDETQTWATIDSPLENLALYQALLDAAVTGDNSDDPTVVKGDVTVNVGDVSFTVPADEVLDLAASLLAAGSDKTAELTVDRVVNVSKFLEVADDLAVLVDDYSYTGDEARDEEYDTTIKILVQDTNDPTIWHEMEVNLSEVVQFNTLPNTVEEDGDWDANDSLDTADLDGITGFTQTADDALQVIEYVHDNGL